MKAFFAIANLIGILWSAYLEFKRARAAAAQKKAEERLQKIEAAIEKAKKAKTPQEAFDAQKDIVGGNGD